MRYTLLVTDYHASLASDDLSMLIDAAVLFWNNNSQDVTVVENASDKIVWLNGEYV